jgi:hypothetical protein
VSDAVVAPIIGGVTLAVTITELVGVNVCVEVGLEVTVGVGTNIGGSSLVGSCVFHITRVLVGNGLAVPVVVQVGVGVRLG